MKLRKVRTSPVKREDQPVEPVKPSPVPDDQRTYHVEIFRIPPGNSLSNDFRSGPVHLQLAHVHTMTAGASATPDLLLGHLARGDNWFITKRPGRYAAMGWLYGHSFTFYVDKEGQYHEGWDQWTADRMQSIRERTPFGL